MATSGWVTAVVLALILLAGVGLVLGIRRWRNRPAPLGARARRQSRDTRAGSADLREIQGWLRDGATCVVIGGPPGGGQRVLLNELVDASGDLPVSAITDLTSARAADAVDLLEDVAASLRRQNIAELRRFARHVETYRARAGGGRSTAERVGAAVQQGVAFGSDLLPVGGAAVRGLATSDVANERGRADHRASGRLR